MIINWILCPEKLQFNHEISFLIQKYILNLIDYKTIDYIKNKNLILCLVKKPNRLFYHDCK